MGSAVTKFSGGEHEGVIVGSAAFAESQILAEIYAGALVWAGFNARTQLSIGAREASAWGTRLPVRWTLSRSLRQPTATWTKATASTAQEGLRALPPPPAPSPGGSGLKSRPERLRRRIRFPGRYRARDRQKYGLQKPRRPRLPLYRLKLRRRPGFARRAYSQA